MQATPDPVWITDSEGHILDLNPAAERLFGPPREQALGRDLGEVLGAKLDLTGSESSLLGQRVELQARQADGAKRILELAAVRLEGVDPPMVAAFVRDLSQQRAAEEALKASRELLQAVTEGIPDPMFVKDLQGHYLLVNAAGARAFGRSVQDTLGKYATDLFPPGMARGIQDADRRVIQSGSTETYEDIATNGEDLKMYLTTKGPYRDRDGQIIGVFGIARDITERKRAEEAVHEWKDRYEAASQASRHILYDSPLKGDIVTYGGPLTEILGYTPEEMAGGRERWIELIHPEDREAFRKQVAHASVESKKPVHLEYRILKKDGSVMFVRDDGQVVLDAEGRIVRFIGFVTDVTEHKLLEEKLRQAQKMEAIGQLAGGVAHEFNNVLTVILGYSDVLMGLSEGSAEAARVIEDMRNAAERAASLTQQLLAFSRKQVLAPVVLDLNVVIADAEKLLRRIIGEDIEILTRTGRSLGRVLADPGQIGQVLLNLALNARDAMPRGGCLTLETSNVELEMGQEPNGSGLNAGPYVLLVISDTGHGMDQATRSRLFEPFFTTKGLGKGTGLGLATVYGIVKQSGGHIDVESSSGNGTVFRIYLPIFREGSATESSTSLQTMGVAGRETILLVEDEEQVRSMLCSTLRSRGYTVLEAGRGHEALLLAQEHPETIHLLLTDVVMPRMSGTELAERLRAMRPGLKVLFISGYVDDAQAVRGSLLESEVAFLQKPFPLKTLTRKVRELLGFPAAVPGEGGA